MRLGEGSADLFRRVGLFALVILLCALPGLLLMVGIRVRSGAGEYSQLLFRALAGESVQTWNYGLLQGTTAYTLLEWTVVLLTACIAVLAFAHFYERREAVSMLISVAAFLMGTLAAFQLFAFHGFIQTVENVGDFIQFNWMASQSFLGLLLLGLAAVVRWYGNRQEFWRGSHLLAAAVGMAIVAYALIAITARTPALPVRLSPEAFVSRPYELIPLALFAVAVTVALPALHRQCRSIFSFTLWIAAIPLVASQLYMAFVSGQLFDAGFTGAQITKTMAFGIIFTGLVLDYARMCRSERKLRRRLSVTDRRIRLLFDNAAEAIVIFDADHVVRTWNRRATEIFGRNAEEAQGADVLDVLFGGEDAAQRDRRRFQRYFERVRDNADEPRSQQFVEAVIPPSDGDQMTIEYSIVAAPGRKNKTIFAMLARDISERKELQMRMFQMDRLVTVGTLAAGVVHEIKNPMTYVVTSVELAQDFAERLYERAERCRKIGDPEHLQHQMDNIAELSRELNKMLSTAERGGDRVRRIITDMRILSHGRPADRHPVSVKNTVELALRMTRGKIHHKVRIETDFDDVPCVHADETRLSQVFVNLIINAVQAMEEASIDEPALCIDIESRDDQWVVARFEDNGPGMSREVCERAFQPFFTTKAAEKGTGLGLSLSKSIVESFGGDIEVESSPGRGATFTVVLPVGDADDGGETPS